MADDLGRSLRDRPLNLLLIDNDPILRPGLETALGAKDAVRATAAAETLEQATAWIEEQRKAGLLLPDVAILNLNALVEERGLEAAGQAIERFQRKLKAEVPLLGLEHQHPATLGLWCRRQGMAGYWSRARSLDELLEALFQVRRGYQVWTLPERPRAPVQLQELPRLGLWSGQVASGMVQVDERLYGLQRQREQASWVEKIWIDGAQRELRATRWLLKRFSGRADRALAQIADSQPWELEASSSVPLKSPWEDAAGRLLAGVDGLEMAAASGLTGSFSGGTAGRSPGSRAANASPGSNAGLSDSLMSGPQSMVPQSRASQSMTPRSKAAGRELQALLFEQISLRMPPGLINLTGEPQEIDILNRARRQELLSTVLRCWGDLLTDLRLSNLEPEQLLERRSPLLLDWWSAVLGDFWGKYSTLDLSSGLRQESMELMPILLQEQPSVESAIFRHIPGVEMLFSTLLFATPVTLDGVDYRPESPEAMTRLALLSENLVIQMANAVVQPLLNNFADVDVIKQSFYDKRLLSTREIEKFRNNLSWKYRVGAMFQEAQDIYESRYGLLRFSEPLEEGGVCGISKASVYAPRRTEMANLTSFQQVVTLALEVRDAVAPRVEILTRWAGTAVVYVLTQVVGRGIGLIGRGVVQGVGSSVQDFRKMRKGGD